MRLNGKVALISGGARGMGAEEARIFAREGAKVVIGDISEDDGKAVEAQIAEAGGQALFIRLDVTQEADWAKAVDQAVSSFGKLDVLVNNAGPSQTTQPSTPGTKSWRSTPRVFSWGPGPPCLRC
jgi:3alpha(or 20beta)-hydroxysteroid dehydrogenase